MTNTERTTKLMLIAITAALLHALLARYLAQHRKIDYEQASKMTWGGGVLIIFVIGVMGDLLGYI